MVLVITERQGICYLCQELSDAWQWDLAHESRAWTEVKSHWNEYDMDGVKMTEGALHEHNQMVNLMVNHLVKRRRVARDPNPRSKLT